MPYANEEAIDIARQALLGLEVVHDAAFVHRDIKPVNLFLAMIGGKRIVKILDFGVARVLSAVDRASLGQVRPTAEGMVIGSPRYLSPEQALGKPVDARADIYGMACTLFRMLTGSHVFTGETQVEVLQAHVMMRPDAPSARTSAPLSPAIDAIVLKGLAKKADDRFQTAREMRESLDEALAAVTVSAEAPCGHAEAGGRYPPHRSPRASGSRHHRHRASARRRKRPRRASRRGNDGAPRPGDGGGRHALRKASGAFATAHEPAPNVPRRCAARRRFDRFARDALGEALVGRAGTARNDSTGAARRRAGAAAR